MSDVPIAEQQRRHKRMMESDYPPWQCPQCPNGYQLYIIATDMNICPFCGYKGGRVKAADSIARGAGTYVEIAFT